MWTNVTHEVEMTMYANLIRRLAHCYVNSNPFMAFVFYNKSKNKYYLLIIDSWPEWVIVIWLQIVTRTCRVNLRPHSTNIQYAAYK